MSSNEKRSSIRPLGNRVLLRKIESSNRGGVAKPLSVDPEESTTQEYELIEGPFPLDDEDAADWSLAVGSRVYLARHKGWKIEAADGDELYVADLEDVLAVEGSV